MALPIELNGEVAHRVNYHAGELAHLEGFGPRQLYRVVMRDYGQSPRHWLALQRKGNAEAELAAGWQVKNVAGDAGFKYGVNFYPWFKAVERITAAEFKRRMAKVRSPGSA